MSRSEQHERRRAEIVSVVPGWYRPWLHLAVPTCLGVAVMAVALQRLARPTVLDLLAVPITLLVSFGFEWHAHKHVLHERAPLLGLIYRRHELMHHVIFTHDDMAMRNGRELWLILMPAYAIVLVFLMVAPFAVVVAWLAGDNAAMLMLATSMAFFLAYEWLHMAYHLPPHSRVGGWRVIRALRSVHQRHHDPRLMKRWNFNVTVPVFDWICGTLWSPEGSPERSPERERARPPARRGGARAPSSTSPSS